MKILTPEGDFQKLRLWPESQFACGWKAKAQKILRLWKFPHTCGQGLWLEISAIHLPCEVNNHMFVDPKRLLLHFSDSNTLTVSNLSSAAVSSVAITSSHSALLFSQIGTFTTLISINYYGMLPSHNSTFWPTVLLRMTVYELVTLIHMRQSGFGLDFQAMKLLSFLSLIM